MLKMIVTNFENLIDQDEAISSKTMLLIDDLRRKNYKFTIVTRRDFKEVLSYNKSYPFIDYIVSSFGSYIYDVVNEKFLHLNYLSSKDINKITNYLKNKTIEKFFIEEKVYQLKINNMKKVSLTKLLNEEKMNINYYQLTANLYLTSNKSNLEQSLNKLIKNKKYELTVIAYDTIDCSLFAMSENNYVLKSSTLKNLPKQEKNYIIEENIDEVLTKLNI